jgi:DNA-binding NarL/FixJ family response regulator
VTAKIRVLVADDHPAFRAGLQLMLADAADLEVVGLAENGDQAVELAEPLRPDVVVMDLRMPVVDGTTATARIMASRPATRIVVLTTFDDDDHLYPALAAGACGFLVKDAAPAELLDGIRRAAAGESPFSPAVLGRLVTHAVRAHTGETPTVLPESLTARERDVLALIGTGLSNKEIADRLHLGVTTVKTHVASLMTKTGSTNRVRLALLAAENGLT